MYWLADPAIAPPLNYPQNLKCMQNQLTTHAIAPCYCTLRGCIQVIYETHTVANNGRDSGVVSAKTLGSLEVCGIQILNVCAVESLPRELSYTQCAYL